MGRSVPNENNMTFIDSFIPFSFCMVGLATSIAVISALCSMGFRRKSSTHVRLDHDESNEVTNDLINPSTNIEVATNEHPSNSDTTQTQTHTQTQDDDILIKELPLPPALQQHPNVDPKIAKRAMSERRMSFNLSMKMPRSFSMAKNWDRKGHDVGGKKGKLNTEESMWDKTKGKLQKDDSVWMKTIILGGKCNPDEEEDAIIYEGKGKRISAYHPRKSNAVLLSTQDSNINSEAIPVSQPHEENINNICMEKN